MWCKGEQGLLWDLTKRRVAATDTYHSGPHETNLDHLVDHAISLAQDGMHAKASHILVSAGLAFYALHMSDADVRQCFLNCMAVTITDASWCQAHLPLHFGCLGLRSLSHHASAAFIASYSSSGWFNKVDAHLNRAIDICSISKLHYVGRCLLAPSRLYLAVRKVYLDSFQFQQLMEKSSPADKARLYSVSAKHAASWLSVAPSI